MNTEMQRRALVARDAHWALMELKKLVDEAAQATHDAEFEAVHSAINPSHRCDICTMLRSVEDRLNSPNFETTLSHVRERLRTAAS